MKNCYQVGKYIGLATGLVLVLDPVLAMQDQDETAHKGLSVHLNLAQDALQHGPGIQKIKQSYMDSLPKLELSSVSADSDKAKVIVEFLKNFLHVNMQKHLSPEKPLQGEEELAQKISRLMSQEKPLNFVLPAFPSKSLNLNWVTGKNPDLGEYLSCLTLHHMIESISKIYELVEIQIVTDSFLTRDILKQTMEDTDKFITDMKIMVKFIYPSGKMQFKKIQETCPNLEQMSNENLVQLCKDKGSVNQTLCDEKGGFYKGTKEEMKGCSALLGLNNNADISTYTKAYCEHYGKVSSGFGVVLKESLGNYVDYIRLSINPSCPQTTNVSEKFPISLVYNSHGTPQLCSPFVTKKENSYSFELAKPNKGKLKKYQKVNVIWEGFSLFYFINK